MPATIGGGDGNLSRPENADLLPKDPAPVGEPRLVCRAEATPSLTRVIAHCRGGASEYPAALLKPIVVAAAHALRRDDVADAHRARRREHPGAGRDARGCAEGGAGRRGSDRRRERDVTVIGSGSHLTQQLRRFSMGNMHARHAILGACAITAVAISCGGSTPRPRASTVAQTPAPASMLATAAPAPLGQICQYMDGGVLLEASPETHITPDGYPKCRPPHSAALPAYICSFVTGEIALSESTDPQPYETPSLGSWGKPLNCVPAKDWTFLSNLLQLTRRLVILQGVCRQGEVRNGPGLCLQGVR